MSGENKNCIAAKEAISHPPQGDASDILEPSIPLSSVGMTGMITPKPVTSISRVTKMNPRAAFFLDMAKEIVHRKGAKNRKASCKTNLSFRLFLLMVMD